MASIWKELLFLHGHFARAEDLADQAPVSGPQQQPANKPEVAPRAAAAVPAAEFAGGCA